MTVRDRLASLGTALGDFNQGEFGKDFSMIEGVNPAEGYCAGVALDWTRRVLQSGPGRQAKVLPTVRQRARRMRSPPASAPYTRQTRTLRRMATAFSGQGASYVTTTRKTESDRTVDAAADGTTSQRTIRRPAWACPVQQRSCLWSGSTFTDNPFDLGYEPAGFVSRNRIQNWLNTIRQASTRSTASLPMGDASGGSTPRNSTTSSAAARRGSSAKSTS